MTVADQPRRRPREATAANAAADDNCDLRKEEYKALRDLTLENIRIIERTETLALGAVGAVIIFGLGVKDRPVFYGQAAVAVLIPVLGWVRWGALHKVVKLADRYFREKVEEEGSGLNWSTFYHAQSSGRLGRSRFWLWFWLTVVAVIYALACIRYGPFGEAPAQH